LWGIRPTIIMVAVVGVIRLFLGVLIGLFAGWSDNRFGWFLNNLITFAVSIPVFLVALGAIALIGPEYGVWTFIIGLSLTGWVETSQQVREQTRIIKEQTYVEAARALGSSRRQILTGHIVRQILPMILMLFAFELSNTLMTTAGLGFLGYYVVVMFGLPLQVTSFPGESVECLS
jgi:peptide/nickel transport system permease protein